MKIIGDGFILKSFEAEDKYSLAKHANNKLISLNLRDGIPYPYTLKDAEWFINSVLKNNDPVTQFMIQINNEVTGCIGFRQGENVYRLNAEIGYWLGEEYWGNGVMTNAVIEITKYIFKNFDTVRIFAIPFATNPASARVLEKAGFIKEATIKQGVIKNGRLLDHHIYSTLKPE